MAMQTPPQLYCGCCGLLIPPQQTGSCPRCKYPVEASHEERFVCGNRLFGLEQKQEMGQMTRTLSRELGVCFQGQLNIQAGI